MLEWVLRITKRHFRACASVGIAGWAALPGITGGEGHVILIVVTAFVTSPNTIFLLKMKPHHKKVTYHWQSLNGQISPQV